MGTSTKDFGTGKRESHDSSKFYSRFDEVTWSTDKTVEPVPSGVMDQIYCHSAESMHELPDNSVALAITSPPYYAGKQFDDAPDFDAYLQQQLDVLRELHRVLQPGGRACYNVAGLGRAPYVPLSSYFDAMAREVGFHERGHIIWIKARGSSGSCAWGSFMSPSNPTLRDLHEYVLVFSKGRMDRVCRGVPSIAKADFLAWTLSVWEFPPERAKKIGHPAPFPIELPHRLIQLYSFEDEVVLDPFIGSGTTAIAAKQDGRHYVGYETMQEYIDLAEKRISEAT